MGVSFMKEKTKGIIQIISAFVVPVILLNVFPLVGAIIGMMIESIATGTVSDFSIYFWVGIIIGSAVGLLTGGTYLLLMLLLGMRNISRKTVIA